MEVNANVQKYTFIPALLFAVPLPDFRIHLMLTQMYCCGPGSSVDIVTDNGLDGPGIEFRWGRDIPYLFRPTLGPNQPPVQYVPGLFRA
jgi:hypothetical protein